MSRLLNLRTAPALVAALLLAMLVLQNGEQTTVRLLWLESTHPRWVMILVSALLGALIGLSGALWLRRAR